MSVAPIQKIYQQVNLDKMKEQKLQINKDTKAIYRGRA